LEGGDEVGAEFVEFAGVVLGEFAESARACRCEAEQNLAAVVRVGHAPEESGFFAAVAEFDSAVMAETEFVGDVSDGNEFVYGCACNLEEQLMLLRCEAGADGGFLAEVEEAAEFATEAGEGMVEIFG
jgi:hypothetical protein